MRFRTTRCVKGIYRERQPCFSRLQLIYSDVTGGRMLWFIFFVLLVLWILGMVSTYTLGGWLHVLLVIAVIVLLIQLITGPRRTV